MSISKFIRSFFNLSEPTAFKYEPPKEKGSVEILEDILRLFAPMRPLQIQDGYEVEERFNGMVIRFYKGEADPEVLKSYNFTSLEKEYNGVYIDSYKVDRQEYRSKFKESDTYLWLKIKVNPILSETQRNPGSYQYILNQYNLSLLTTFNTLKESMGSNGGVPTEEVLDLSKNLITKFCQSIEKKRKELDLLRESVRETTNTSHATILRDELEYVEKFIDIKEKIYNEI